jgi:hypothetical protein
MLKNQNIKMRFRILKSDVHNDGIKLGFGLGKDCFLIPYLKTKTFPFLRNSCNPYQKVKYEIMTQKIYAWLWFRFSINLHSVKADLIQDIPIVERLFKMLPPKINVVGKVYKLNFVKDDMIKISYLYEDESLFGEVFSNDLKEVLLIAVNTLKNTDNVRFMRSEYKKLYEESFNIEVPQERKFEPYYE